ncbi:MAG: hypothetical protein ACI8RD_011102 [Bacillariaceae sp.]|jgi:hypothetical protein
MLNTSHSLSFIFLKLVVMGIRSNPKLDPSSNIVRVLIDMYVDIGDHIALQYGGSEAHKKVTAERSESIAGPIGKVCLKYFYIYVKQKLQLC